MPSFNRVILIGNLTRDVDRKHTQSGTAVADLGLAVNDRRKTQSGETVEETTFVDVTLWGRTAEIAAEYLKKGSPLTVTPCWSPQQADERGPLAPSSSEFACVGGDARCFFWKWRGGCWMMVPKTRIVRLRIHSPIAVTI